MAELISDLLKGPSDVKRRSLGFWDGNRLADVLEVAGARKFGSDDRLTVTDLTRDARQCAGCGHHLVLHVPQVDTQTGEVAAPYIHKGYYCQMPAVCPVCSRRVGDVRQARYAPRIETYLEAGLEPYLVTFTVAAGPDLRDQTARLRRAIRRFQVNGRLPSDPEKRAAALRRGRKAGEWQKVVAAGLKIEVKRGELSGEWHVHAHALVFCDSPLDYRIYASREDRAAGVPMRTVNFRGRDVAASKISAEWFCATGGEAMGIDVHPLYRDRKTGKRMTRKGVVLAAREVMKYCSLLDEASTSFDWLEIRAGLWGRRLWSVYGGFRGLPDDDYTEEGDSRFVEEVRVSWRGGNQGDYSEASAPRIVDLQGRKEFSLKCVTLRARVNGITRKMRTAIFRARQAFERSGALPDGFDVEVVSALDGTRVVQSWPRPVYLDSASAADGSGWQKWTDEVTAAGRAMIGSVEKDLSEYDGDDVLGFRLGSDASISHEAWEAWRLVLDWKREARERRAAFGALAFGGIQQDAFAPDYFAPERVAEFVERHGYDAAGFPEDFFAPAREDRQRHLR